MQTHETDLQPAVNGLHECFERQFQEELVLLRPPVTNDEPALETYQAALKQRAERAMFNPGSASFAGNSQASRVLTRLDALSLRLLHLESAGRYTTSSYAPALRLAMGLHDYFPRASKRKERFEREFTLTASKPNNISGNTFATMFAIPDLDVGRFFALTYTAPLPFQRDAATWCGVYISVPPDLHDDLRGPKDIVVTAVGHIDFDYQLRCEPGPHWNGFDRPTAEGAAWVQIETRAELIAYDRATGVLITGAGGGIPAFLSGRSIATVRLFPNGTSMNPTGAAESFFNGGYAGFIGASASASLRASDGVPRQLRTDRTYAIVVSCFVGAHAHVGVKSDGSSSVASANASATLTLRSVTLAIRPHEDGVF